MSKVVGSGYLNVMFLSLSADGIALGAATVLAHTHLTMIVFIAIMLHKVRLCSDILIGLNEQSNQVYQHSQKNVKYCTGLFGTLLLQQASREFLPNTQCMYLISVKMTLCDDHLYFDKHIKIYFAEIYICSLFTSFNLPSCVQVPSCVLQSTCTVIYILLRPIFSLFSLKIVFILTIIFLL